MTSLRIAVLFGTLALSACGGGAPQSGQDRADAQTAAACRQRADEAYDTRNRGQIYTPASQVNTPYSANYTPGIGSGALSDLFEHDKTVSNCIRNTGTGAERSAPPAEAH